jgi:hypothetical protein
MRITKTTIAIIVFCFFTMQLKANEPIDVFKTVRQGALQEALELIMKDFSGTSLSEVKLSPLKNFSVTSRPAKDDTPKPATKPSAGKRKILAPIVKPSKFRFGISDKEI